MWRGTPEHIPWSCTSTLALESSQRWRATAAHRNRPLHVGGALLAFCCVNLSHFLRLCLFAHPLGPMVPWSAVCVALGLHLLAPSYARTSTGFFKSVVASISATSGAGTPSGYVNNVTKLTDGVVTNTVPGSCFGGSTGGLNSNMLQLTLDLGGVFYIRNVAVTVPNPDPANAPSFSTTYWDGSVEQRTAWTFSVRGPVFPTPHPPPQPDPPPPGLRLLLVTAATAAAVGVALLLWGGQRAWAW
jgi:hypothetical protein